MDHTLIDESASFTDAGWGLDRRVSKAVMKLGFVNPTLVQSRAVPLALEGKDLLVRARTGSGKTLAYSMPLLHKILAGVRSRCLTHGPSASEARFQCLPRCLPASTRLPLKSVQKQQIRS